MSRWLSVAAPGSKPTRFRSTTREDMAIVALLEQRIGSGRAEPDGVMLSGAHRGSGNSRGVDLEVSRPTPWPDTTPTLCCADQHARPNRPGARDVDGRQLRRVSIRRKCCWPITRHGVPARTTSSPMSPPGRTMTSRAPLPRVGTDPGDRAAETGQVPRRQKPRQTSRPIACSTRCWFAGNIAALGNSGQDPCHVSVMPKGALRRLPHGRCPGS